MGGGGNSSRSSVTFSPPRGEVTFSVDVVKTQEDQEKGLGGREKLGEKEGMLFVYDKATVRHFWMKDMRFPIDILFVGTEGTVVHAVTNLQPCKKEDDVCPSYSSMEPTISVIEIKAGLAEKYGIKRGTPVVVR
jgi:uncharacterized membrane protein (UPF0127 family)